MSKRRSERNVSEPKPTAPDENEFCELLRRAREGEDQAISQLLENYRNLLLLIANQDLDHAIRKKLGASDVVQVSMLTAHQQFDRFSGKTDPELKAWLRKILANDLLHAWRTYRGTQKRQIDREQPLQFNSSLESPLVDPQFTPRTNAVAAEEKRIVDQSMTELPDGYRSVIEMHNLQYMSFEEIGQLVDKSTDAVRKTWTRAVLKLQQIIEKNNLAE